MSNGTKIVEKKLEDPTSMLYRLVAASKNQEAAERLMKRNYFGMLVIAVLNILYLLFCIWYLKESPIVIILLLGFLCGWSIISFVISASYEYFNFGRIKKLTLILMILFFLLFSAAILSKLFCLIILPMIFMIPINRDITTGMVVWLARGLYSISLMVPVIYIGVRLITPLFSEKVWPKIDAFKIRKYVDLRKDKKFRYDLNFIKKAEDGRAYTIKEKDRKRHMLLSGVTGTGKTSSALIPAVTSDLDHKAANEDYCKKELLSRIVTMDDLAPKKGMTDASYNIDAFEAYSDGARELLSLLKSKAPSAGITVIAPNADFADAVYELATKRGFKVNRVDPIPLNPATWEMKPGFIGFNPLYISPDLPEAIRKTEIFSKSRMFSDVLQALYDQSEKTDAYFTSLNRYLTTMLAILIMTTYPWLHNGEQPDMTAVQEVINDFSCVRKYLFALAKIVGVGDSLKSEWDVTSEWLMAHKFGDYQFIVSQISYDLLGGGRTKMEDQARGLRIILNEFLTDPYIKNVFCCGQTVNIDHTLSKGEITVVNYALELGMSIATGFGLFYCLSFNQAVLRRPGNEESRLLHLYYCDEFPVLMHKDMEQIFTLFRQFCVCFTCAFQTFSQFDRNDATKFLKKVVLSNVGHHIVYGNCSIEEMELYNKLAGKKLHFIEQETVSQTSISSPQASISFSTRTTPEFADAIEGFQLRNKDFQEVTVFGINNGDHIPPFAGKLSFLTKKQREGKRRCVIDWERYVREEETEVTAVHVFDSESVWQTETENWHSEKLQTAFEIWVGEKWPGKSLTEISSSQNDENRYESIYEEEY